MNRQSTLSSFAERLGHATRPAREKFQTVVLNMSPRDRILLVALVAAVALGLLLLGGMGMRKNLRAMRASLANRESQMMMVNELRMSYSEASGKKEEIDRQLKERQDLTLSAFLEKAADKAQIRDNLKQVKERSATTLGDLEEKQFSVQVSRVTLEQLSGFLFEIEAAGFPLKVKTLKLKSVVVSGVKMIDANLEISAYKLVETAEAGT